MLASARASGYSVAARKPAQSFDPASGPTDAEVLASATGEDPGTVCASHRWYGVAYAPPMAADSLGLAEIRLRDLIEEVAWPADRVDIGVVETAGGVASPQAHDGDALRLLTDLEPDWTVLVADAALGTVNSTRLSLAALGGTDGGRVIVVVNRFDPHTDLHRRNLEWLEREGIDPVVGQQGASAYCGGELLRRMFRG